MKTFSKLIAMLLVGSNAYGQSPATIPNNTLSLGKTGAANKTFEANLSKAGASTNPKIRWDNATSLWKRSNDGTTFGTIATFSDKLSSFAATSSAELASVLSDETGTGSVVYSNSPTLVTPALGTPSALVGTNITGTASGLSIGGNAATSTAFASNPTDCGANTYATSIDASGNLTCSSVTAGSSNQSFDLSNLGLSASVSANALTVALKQNDGSTDPAAGAGAVGISFRSSTLTSGSYLLRSVTSALSVVIPSGTTIGTVSGVAEYIYVYAIDNAGSVELALSLSGLIDQASTQNTTAISGGTSRSTLYSTTARTGVAVRLIGRIKATEATAGTWATNASEVSLVPFEEKNTPSQIYVDTFGGRGSTNTRIVYFTNVQTNQGSDISYTSSAVNGDSFTINTTGLYSMVLVPHTSSGGVAGISINSSALTSDIQTLTYAQGFRGYGEANMPIPQTLYLTSGDIVRVQSDASNLSANKACIFNIVKIR